MIFVDAKKKECELFFISLDNGNFVSVVNKIITICNIYINNVTDYYTIEFVNILSLSTKL